MKTMIYDLNNIIMSSCRVLDEFMIIIMGTITCNICTDARVQTTVHRIRLRDPGFPRVPVLQPRDIPVTGS